MAKSKILLLPGFLSGPSAWDAVADRLPGEITVIRADLPGFGEISPELSPYSLGAVVDALRPIVDSRGPTHIVGHSMGGIIALALARTYPEIEGIGVVGLPVFESTNDARTFLGRRGPVMRLLVQHHSLAHAGCVLARNSQRAWVPAARLRWRHQPPAVFRNAFAHSESVHEGALGDIIFGGHIRAIASHVGCPVFMIHGDEDTAAPMGAARALACGRGWPFTAVSGGTHQVHVERPEMVSGWLRDLVARSRIAGEP